MVVWGLCGGIRRLFAGTGGCSKMCMGLGVGHIPQHDDIMKLRVISGAVTKLRIYEDVRSDQILKEKNIYASAMCK
jgi:hypothetical protein